MRLSNHLVDSIPRSFYTHISHEPRPVPERGHTKGSPGRVHGVFQTGLFNQPLDVGDLGRDGGAGCPHLLGSVSRVWAWIWIGCVEWCMHTGIKQKSAVHLAGVGIEESVAMMV